MALPSTSARVLSNSAAKPSSVKPSSKRWQPPEGAREKGLADDEPLFFSRQHTADGQRTAIDRVRARQIVKAASERADVRVLALRATGHGAVGEPAPAHPHLFRHAWVRQIVRHTQSLALAQKQAGWARLHTKYLTLSDDETRRLMRGVPE